MNDWLQGVLVVSAAGLIIGTVFLLMFYVGRIDYEQYPRNVFKWREHELKREENFRVERISRLEHNLGYLPCSDDRCYDCKRMLKERGTDYTSEFATMVSDRAMAILPIAKPDKIKK